MKCPVLSLKREEALKPCNTDAVISYEEVHIWKLHINNIYGSSKMQIIYKEYIFQGHFKLLKSFYWKCGKIVAFIQKYFSVDSRWAFTWAFINWWLAVLTRGRCGRETYWSHLVPPTGQIYQYFCVFNLVHEKILSKVRRSLINHKFTAAGGGTINKIVIFLRWMVCLLLL